MEYVTDKDYGEELGGYALALTAAGAKVLKFECFGSYQGDWLAKVIYKGKEGWVRGAYGSCSGCDAFEAEIDYSPENKGYNKADLVKLGNYYLDDFYTYDEILSKQKENISWDLEAGEMIRFIEANK